MTKYIHVEDFIQIICGWRDPATNKTMSIWDNHEPLVNLARYDVRIMDSFCTQIDNGQGFTDRQAELAKNLVVKYQRQLAKKGVELPEELKFKFPVRTINRTCAVWADDNGIYLRFPFIKEWIESIKASQKTSQGVIKWDREKKIWHMGLTEYNLSWAYTFAKEHSEFTIDASVQDLMDKLSATEAKPYAIQLTIKDKALTIDNAADSLVEYIEGKGGFTDDNLLRLVDMSGTLSYTIDPVIEETVAEAYGPRFLSLCINRELKIDPGVDARVQVLEIVKYAEATQRYPICIYEPDLSGRLLEMFKPFFSENDITVIKNQEMANFNSSSKVVYTHKIPRSWTSDIPLLISGAGMMFGGDRQIWLQAAEKVVYFAKDIYNKSSKGKEVCKLD